ncbi:solute carrier family 28 member 3 [Neodiprion virginianus]|uniref:solute carrier family 28 member 3 n=1 Tax=Neodiprion virginianus TaxID=2961670 RepID=UPI001EE6A2BC|nr:solute carrier family 28 member 3 [Neodiprion virginianus]
MPGMTNKAFTEEEESCRRYDENSLQIPLEQKGTQVYSAENESDKRENIEDDKMPELNAGCFATGRNAIGATFSKHPKIFKLVWVLVLNVGVFVYFGFATRYWWVTYGSLSGQWCEGYGLLIILFVITYGSFFYVYIIRRYFGRRIAKCLRPLGRCWKSFTAIKCVERFGSTVFYLAILLAVLVFMVIDTVDSRDRLISLLGVFVLLGLGFIFSKHPAYINWTPVFWGIILQFCFGLFTIRWSVGRAIFQCISDKMATFLNYTVEGATFVFSETLVSTYAVFAFASLPVIFFFSFFIQILYYLGTMQLVVMKLGGLLQSVMGTTVCESITAVANIFLSMSESPLLIKPYISSLTSSEIHTVMASGFATVSGTVLAAYIRFGAQPAHLITASVMSAPAALCYSKLFYPETENSKTTRQNIELKKSEDTSILDAASKGANVGIAIYLGVIANIVAFVSAVAFLNGIVSWLGELVGYEDINFEWFLSKIFIPLSWVMGVPWDECEAVATLIGLKTIVNEFVAYQRMGEYKEQNMLSPRTEAIATYAICGFSNPGSVGIMIGALASMAPEKRAQISSVAVRAFITGSAVCFMTACIAGMLMTDDFYTTISSSTNSTS